MTACPSHCRRFINCQGICLHTAIVIWRYRYVMVVSVTMANVGHFWHLLPAIWNWGYLYFSIKFSTLKDQQQATVYMYRCLITIVCRPTKIEWWWDEKPVTWLTGFVVSDPAAVINSLTPGRFKVNFRWVICKLILVVNGWGISCETSLTWVSVDHTYS